MTAFLKKAALFLQDAFKKHKIVISITSLFLVLVIVLTVVMFSTSREKNTNPEDSQLVFSSSEVSAEESSEISSIEEVSSEAEPSSSEEASSSSSSAVSSASSSKKPTSSATSVKPTTSSTTSKTNNDFKYNSNTDINDNVFLDSLVYTGYNLKKHIADGNMWVYILASQKRGLGYLSNIGYAGGSTGYETTSSGLPDIKYFERKGLVCASFVTYVYFNYLPNVAGIDTSSLTKPNKSYSANDWYISAKDWVKKGYSQTISFKASKTSSGYIKFNPDKNIPIGSLMFCCDARNRSDYCSHVSIYAGYKNGYHWVYHVGNANGPEFCAMERMHFGPDPQWPINIITTPKNIRMEAAVEITVKDDSSNPLAGVSFSLKNTKSGKSFSLGKTDSKGTIIKENLPYGKYELTQTPIEGYTAKQLTQTIELTTANNSYNKISSVNTKIVVEPEVSSEASSSASASSQGSSSQPTSSSETVTSSEASSSSGTPVSSESVSSAVSSNTETSSNNTSDDLSSVESVSSESSSSNDTPSTSDSSDDTSTQSE